MEKKLYLILDRLNSEGVKPFVLREVSPQTNGGFEFATHSFEAINNPGDIPEHILLVSADLTHAAVNSRWRKTIEKIFKDLGIQPNLTSFGKGSETQNKKS